MGLDGVTFAVIKWKTKKRLQKASKYARMSGVSGKKFNICWSNILKKKTFRAIPVPNIIALSV